MQMADDEDSPFEPLKILVRDLAPVTTQDDLNGYFSQFSDVSEVVIPHNSVAGIPHSFGFVVFKYSIRIPFILQMPHWIHDRCVEVSRALKGEDLQTLESQRNPTGSDNLEKVGNFDERKLFVLGSVSRFPRFTNDEFVKFFQGFGNLIDCSFCIDTRYGYVIFRTKRDAGRVLSRRSYTLKGERLNVNRLKRIPVDHYNPQSPNVGRSIDIREDRAAGSSGGDHAHRIRDMQPQAAGSDKETRNVKISLAAASSGVDHVTSTKYMQTLAAVSDGNTKIIQAAASSGIDDVTSTTDVLPQAAEISGINHVNSTTEMQPEAAASVGDAIDVQIIPAAVSPGLDHVTSPTDMQPLAAASDGDTRKAQIIQAAASSGIGNITSTTDVQPLAAASSVTDHVNSTTEMQPDAAASVGDAIGVRIIPNAASSRIDHINSTTEMQPEAAASSGIDHVTSTPDVQPLAAASVDDTIDMQVVPDAATSGFNHVNGTTDMQPQAAASSGIDHVSSTTEMQPKAAASIDDAIDVQIIPAAASSGINHVTSTTDTQSQAATSDGDTRDVQIHLAAASSGNTTEMQPQAAASTSDTRDMEIVPAAASSGTDHVASTTVMQPRDVESVSQTRDKQIVPIAVNSGRRKAEMFGCRKAANFGHRSNSYYPNHSSNEGLNFTSGLSNFPPSCDQRTLPPLYYSQMINKVPANSFPSVGVPNFPHLNTVPLGVPGLQFPGPSTALHQPYNRMGTYTNDANCFPCVGVPKFPRINWYNMVPVGAPEFRFPGPSTAFHQPYNGMGTYINATNNFSGVGVANFPQNYADYGNFPMEPTDFSDKDCDNTNG